MSEDTEYLLTIALLIFIFQGIGIALLYAGIWYRANIYEPPNIDLNTSGLLSVSGVFIVIASWMAGITSILKQMGWVKGEIST